MGIIDLPAEVTHRLESLGQRIRAARQARNWTIAEMAGRAGLNRNTLGALERGKPGVAMSAYATVLWVLGLDRTLEGVADPREDAHRESPVTTSRRHRVRKRNMPAQ